MKNIVRVVIVVFFAALYGASMLAETKADMASVWTDPATGLTWTKADNGSDVDWNQASAYCANLRLGGNSGWRLPTIDELQGVYDPNVSVSGQWGNGQAITWHVKGNLKLTGWHWSSSQGNASGEALRFGFNDEERYSYLLAYSGYSRALCVRRSGE